MRWLSWRPSSHRARIAASCAAYCQGDLLEELDGISVAFDHWLLSERTRFVEQRRALLEQELSHARGDNAAANERAEIARRLIMFDPTHEGASRVLMRALADMGERAQALREFGRCREALKAALDVEPSLETVALYEAIRMFSGPDKDEAGIASSDAAQEESQGEDARTQPQSPAGRGAAISCDRPAWQ